jgi:hypothetical protein
MIRASVLWLALIMLGSCTQKMICPAYQSSFIYDKEALRKKFSYFKEDSTPKVMYTASKNKYLVAVPESYRKKTRSLQTVEMAPVYPVIPDSLKINKGENELQAEVSLLDSTAGAPASDSAYAITKTKEKYNVDQDIYMWYFRDMLVLPDVRAAMETQSENRASKAGPTKKKKKGLFSFLKKKDPADSLDAPTPGDSTSAPPKKKGFLGIFRKKDVKTNVPAEKKKDPAKKEDEDDGF